MRTVLSETGNLSMARDYYPYGLEMPQRIYTNQPEAKRYQFQGHERDEEVAYDYHGARFYNPKIGTYLSVDPLAHMDFQWTSFRFGYSNPINFIDPTGMLENDYKLNLDGSIEFVRETASETDELYAVDAGGRIMEDRSVSVTKGTFDNKISSDDGNTTGFYTSNVEDAKSVYKFASDNSQTSDFRNGVEYGFIEYSTYGENRAALVTDGYSYKVGATKMGKDLHKRGAVVTGISHNHPKGSPPSGYSEKTGKVELNSFGGRTGDAERLTRFYRNSQGSIIKRTVYDAKNQNIYNYNIDNFSTKPASKFFLQK